MSLSSPATSPVRWKTSIVARKRYPLNRSRRWELSRRLRLRGTDNGRQPLKRPATRPRARRPVAGVFCAVVSQPADNLVSKLNANKSATVGSVVAEMGMVGLFTRGLPLRIVMVRAPRKHIFPELVVLLGPSYAEDKRIVESLRSLSDTPSAPWVCLCSAVEPPRLPILFRSAPSPASSGVSTTPSRSSSACASPSAAAATCSVCDKETPPAPCAYPVSQCPRPAEALTQEYTPCPAPQPDHRRQEVNSLALKYSLVTKLLGALRQQQVGWGWGCGSGKAELPGVLGHDSMLYC